MKDEFDFNVLKKMKLCFVMVLNIFKGFVVVLFWNLLKKINEVERDKRKINEGEGDKSERREK
jgi:hypothetical protein